MIDTVHNAIIYIGTDVPWGKWGRKNAIFVILDKNMATNCMARI